METTLSANMKKYNSPFRSYTDERKPTIAEQRPAFTTAPADRKAHCKHCDCGFDSETEAEVHTWVTHRNELEMATSELAREGKICFVCRKQFRSVEIRNLHVRRRHLYVESSSVTKINRPIYVCNECNIICFNKGMFMYHMRSRHEYLSKKVGMNCPKCDKYVMVRTMSQHMDYVHMIRSVKMCPICLVKQVTVEGVLEHILKEHPPTFVCNFCRHRAVDEPSLDVHLREAHGKRASEGPAPPGTELLRYFTSDRTKYHQRKRLQFPDRELNLRDMLHVCVLCQEVVDTPHRMRDHVASAHGHGMLPPPPPPHPPARKRCHCGADFRNELLLRHHIFTEHGPMLLEVVHLSDEDEGWV